MATTKDQRVAEARRHLELATAQWDDAAVASWEPADPAGCVSTCFYAFENAVVAAAIALDIPWKKNHWQKATVAATLFALGKVKTNISDTLLHLNEVRKDISYGDPGPLLADTNLEDLVSDLDNYVAQVTMILDEVEDSN